MQRWELPLTISVILLLIVGGPLAVYTYTWWLKANSAISVDSVEAFMLEDGRYLQLTVTSRATRDVTLQSVEVNGTALHINRTRLAAGAATALLLSYYWVKGTRYVVNVSTAEGTHAEQLFTTPIFSAQPELTVESLTPMFQDSEMQLEVTYRINATGAT